MSACSIFPPGSVVQRAELDRLGQVAASWLLRIGCELAAVALQLRLNRALLDGQTASPQASTTAPDMSCELLPRQSAVRRDDGFTVSSTPQRSASLVPALYG